ncbi:MAG: prepilin peptidase [Gammaproteobacteria bacterium]
MMSPALAEAAILAVFGALVGSFLNVVIHRLPRMLERRWKQECEALQADTGNGVPETASPGEAYNLVLPRSACPHCGHQIRWYENIPLISYAFLRGRCSSCATSISLRYPLVELCTALLFAWCGWRWGLSWETLAWAGFAAALVALTGIDWDTTLLPDDITLPLLWAGLVLSAMGVLQVSLSDALWGAVGGYLSLWLVYWAFRLVTGKEGMGYGDFKLFAALGAWFGWSALVPLILMASVIGAITGIAIKLFGQLREGGYVPFGPFLALAGLTAMIAGADSILAAIGL